MTSTHPDAVDPDGSHSVYEPDGFLDSGLERCRCCGVDAIALAMDVQNAWEWVDRLEADAEQLAAVITNLLRSGRDAYIDSAISHHRRTLHVLHKGIKAEPSSD